MPSPVRPRGEWMGLPRRGADIRGATKGGPIPVRGTAPHAQGAFICPIKSPRGTRAYTISGVTKDSAGVVLGSCVVDLFTTTDNVLFATVVSDPTTGAYSFLVPSNGWAFYAVAYKAGAPDVAGTTVNTLVGV